MAVDAGVGQRGVLVALEAEDGLVHPGGQGHSSTADLGGVAVAILNDDGTLYGILSAGDVASSLKEK